MLPEGAAVRRPWVRAGEGPGDARALAAARVRPRRSAAARRRPYLVALGFSALAAGCGGAGPAGDVEPRGGAVPSLDAGDPALHAQRLDAEARRWVDATLAGLDTRARAAQLVIPWIAGGFVSPSSPEFETPRRWVEDVGVGGIYVSIGTPHGMAARVNALQRRAAVPLLVTSDFESGGPGMRLPPLYTLPGLFPNPGGTDLPPTMAFGAIDEERFAREYGRITGAEARAVGVQLNFAPVLDVNSNPENPVINTRAFGGDPARVARLGVAYAEGSRAAGVQATAKHFPGHGDTRVDSHLELPVVDADRARLDAVELVPFAAAIDAGVEAVMTAHLALPGLLGPGAPPATLAPEILTGLLREEMGFEGLLLTDALSMAAVADAYSPGEAAVRSLQAGADVILFPPDVDAAVDAMVAAVEEGRVSPDRLEASVRRVLETKARAGLHRAHLVDLDAVEARVGTGAHRAFADTAAARSVTLVRDEDRLVPLPRGSRVLSLTVAPRTDLLAGRSFDGALRGGGLDVRAFRLDPARAGDPGAYDSLSAAAAAADVVVAGVYLPSSAGTGQDALPAPLRAWLRRSLTLRPTILASLGNPYLLSAVPDVGTYLVAWGGRDLMQRAAGRALAGTAPISGRLPIDLPPGHFIGDGLSRVAAPPITDPDMGRMPDLDRLRPAGERVRGVDEAPVAGPPGEAPPDTAPAPGATPRDTALPGAPTPPGVRSADALPMAMSFVEVDPSRVAMDPVLLRRLDSLVLAALADSVSPGAALAVGRRGELVRLRGYGHVDWGDDRPATPATLWDLASLTKVVATTTAVMTLVDDGRLDLDAPVVRYLPEWAAGDARKARVTVRHLLLHRAGLPPFRRWFAEMEGEAAYRAAVAAEPLERAPDTETVYSDIGFITLGWIVEAVSGEPLERYVQRRIFAPLGMDDTGYLPDPALLPRIAPTEVDTLWRGEHVHGVVHDENADAMGGVAGHAGIFSTAWDLAAFAEMMLGGGAVAPCVPAVGSGEACTAPRPDSVRVVEAGTVERFTRRADPSISRALGWDTPEGPRASAGDYFTAAAFGHTGFTGTSLWMDPELDLFVVLLTARVNPTRENSRHVELRRAVHDLAARAITDRPVERRRGGR